MAVASPPMQSILARKEGLDTGEIRTLIAEHLDVNLKRVTDGAHFIRDLGADWLDHLELMIMVEDRFSGLEITEDDIDQIEVVGDLIRYVETWFNTKQQR